MSSEDAIKVAYVPLGSTSLTVGTSDGPTETTIRLILVPAGSPTCLPEPPTPRKSYWKTSAFKPSSRTLPIRMCVLVQIIKNGKKITAFVLRDGFLNYIEDNNEILVTDCGHKGHGVGHIPGVHFKVAKVVKVFLLVLYKEKKERPQS